MFNEGQHEAFTAVSILFNTLSFFSCIWLFYLYIKSPSPYTVQFRMLINLTLSDFLIAITGFITHFSYSSDRICTSFIFFSLVGYWSSAFWSSFVAIFSYKKIVKSFEFNSNRFYNRSVVFWMLTCILLPLLPAFGTFGIQYIVNQDFCVISFTTTTPLKLFLFTEGIPLMTAIIVTAISYIKQIMALKNLPDHVLTMINIKASKLSWYSIAQCLVFIPGLVCQLVYIYAPYDSLILNAIRLYGFRLAGFVNSLVYGIQRMKLGQSQAIMFRDSIKPESLLISDSEGFYEQVDDGERSDENMFH